MNAIAARAIEAMDFLVDAVQQIPSESWDQPSNLDGWSIRDLVVHTTGSAAKLVALAGGQTSEPTDDLQQLAARLKDALAKEGSRHVAQLSHRRPDHSRLGRVPIAASAGRGSRRPAGVLPSGGGGGTRRRATSAGDVRAGQAGTRGRDADRPAWPTSGARLRSPNARCCRLIRCDAAPSASSRGHRRRRPRSG